MTLYLPDTNAYSAFASGRFPALVEKMVALRHNIILSAIVLAEMKYGWLRAGDTKRVVGQRAFVGQFNPSAFDANCANMYALLKNFLLHARIKTHGNANPIGERDMLIAAHAMALRAVLVTHNIREFFNIPGLEVEDWEKQQARHTAAGLEQQTRQHGPRGKHKEMLNAAPDVPPAPPDMRAD
jgi:tRNA(fMet)-specific endonuclease VapC